jgi:hypothetical protein
MIDRTSPRLRVPVLTLLLAAAAQGKVTVKLMPLPSPMVDGGQYAFQAQVSGAGGNNGCTWEVEERLGMSQYWLPVGRASGVALEDGKDAGTVLFSAKLKGDRYQPRSFRLKATSLADAEAHDTLAFRVDPGFPGGFPGELAKLIEGFADPARGERHARLAADPRPSGYLDGYAWIFPDLQSWKGAG